jgi:hypothetical protein
MEELPQEKPYKDYSDDWYKGFAHGKTVGIEEGRKQIVEELKRLLELT